MSLRVTPRVTRTSTSNQKRPRTPVQVTSAGCLLLSVSWLSTAQVRPTGGEPEQASKDALRDAVFANAGACSSPGVTLRL